MGSNKIDKLQAHTTEKFKHERHICEQKFNRLADDLEDNRQTRERENKRFQDSAKAEIEAVKQSCEAETRARAQADDDIVTALNHDTKGLQEALRSVSQDAKSF